ncbi:hypothetical protein IGI04_014928 [Brassica rapa subsp. trilocularis]|uniref:Uncharacterized protein n=1 Tax=Brassica rapa subsp. trilocularis TaxID=1813537 RepID=A0ABQ7MNK0_BRACM|nr:hypothetical protein IGI04_014928 [Brassica rapa subsp. trilocularis]
MPQPSSHTPRSDISPPLTAKGHHCAPDVETNPVVETQPRRSPDAPSRATRRSAGESHAPPPPSDVRRSHRSWPPLVRRREAAAASPPPVIFR